MTNKIAVLMLGNASPGGNNIVDGLLKFQNQRKNTTLIGFVNGIEGLLNDQILTISEESFAPYRNLGGFDYLGRSSERLPRESFEKVAMVCAREGITGLILVGATHTLTDAATLSENFLENNISTKVVAIPTTLDGNIRHGYF